MNVYTFYGDNLSLCFDFCLGVTAVGTLNVRARDLSVLADASEFCAATIYDYEGDHSLRYLLTPGFFSKLRLHCYFSHFIDPIIDVVVTTDDAVDFDSGAHFLHA